MLARVKMIKSSATSALGYYSKLFLYLILKFHVLIERVKLNWFMPLKLARSCSMLIWSDMWFRVHWLSVCSNHRTHTLTHAVVFLHSLLHTAFCLVFLTKPLLLLLGLRIINCPLSTSPKVWWNDQKSIFPALRKAEGAWDEFIWFYYVNTS